MITTICITLSATAAVTCSSVFNNDQTYQTTTQVITEMVEGSSFEIIRFPQLNYAKKYFSYDFKFKDLFTLTYDQFFAKVIKPAIINDWAVYRYRLSDFLVPTDNQILIGFDKNHSYLLLYDKETQKYVRADAGPNVEFSIISDTKSISSGLFMKFEGVSDEKYAHLVNYIKEDNKFMTCSHGSCSAIQKIGVNMGADGSAVENTQQLLNLIVSQNINISDPNITVDIFTLDNQPIDVQIAESNNLSEINTSIRHKTLKGYYILVKSFGKTMHYWFFNKVGLIKPASNP